MSQHLFLKGSVALCLSLSHPAAGLAQTPSDPGLLLKRVTSGPITTVGQAAHMATWGDYDGDGHLDLFVLNYTQPSALFRNNGAGELTLVADSAVGGPILANAVTTCWGDCDNDGDLDLVVAYPGVPVLWRNNGNGTFTEAPETGMTPTGQQTYGAAWADYDADGRLDLTVVNAFLPNVLFHNEGGGRFARVTAGPVVSEAFPSVNLAWGDYDNDGLSDLFVSTGDGIANLLYRNAGDGIFTRVTQGGIVTDPGYSTGAAWGDYDNDGFLDLFVARRLGSNLLYHNNRDGTFTRITDGSLVNDGGESNSGAWADFDNDGFLDLFVANWQGGVNFLYHNNGDGTFTRITSGDVANDPPGECVGTAWGDYTGDGFVDLFVARLAGPGYLYRNTDNGNAWLKVRLVGVVSPRGGNDAKVRVKTMHNGVERWQLRQIGGAQGWGDQGLEALFGLGNATAVAAVRVEWPSGAVTELRDLAARQTITIIEQPPLLTMRPKGGLFTNSVDITLATPLPDGRIRYTLDNTEPTPTASLYTQPITLLETTTVQARVFTNDQPASAIITNVYTRKVVPPSVVAPNRFATLPGEGYGSVFSTPIRIQHVYGAPHFPAAPILITEIRLRPWAGQGAGSGTVPEFSVRLSTTAKAPDQLSALFAENIGVNETLAFSGSLPVACQSSSPGTQTGFDMAIPLTQPFLYDPAQGNLLVDFRNSTGVPLPEPDATDDPDDLASRVWTHTNLDGATAQYSDTGANIMQFLYAEKLPALYMFPAGGSATQPVWVTLLTSFKNGVMRYTLDGTEPTVAATAYAGPLKLIQTTTVRARTFVDDQPVSEIVSASYQITLTPPTITSTLQSQAATEGTSPAYTAAATGSAPLSFQWRFEGQELPGATNATLRLANVQLAQAGTYSLRVTNDAGADLRALWVLQVNPKPVAPTIVVGPQPMMAIIGSTVTFSAVVTGTEPLTYEWRDRLNRVVGRAASLTLTNVQTAAAGNYTLRVYNAVGARVSSPAELKVVAQPVAPSILRPPAGLTVLAGADAILSVGLQATEPVVCEWRWNGRAIAGVTGSVLRLTQVQPGQAGTYTVLVTNPAGSALSSGAVLDVIAPDTGGTVRFANRGDAFDAPVYDNDGATRLEGASFLAQLYAGPSAASLAPVGAAVPFGTAANAGYVQPFDPVRTLPGVAPGSAALVQIRAWHATAGPTFEDALLSGGKTGTSAVLSVTTGGNAPPPPPGELAGLTSFSIARETVPPTVVITSPQTAATGDERFVLSGTVSDNIGAATVEWAWDDKPMGSLTVADGAFRLTGLTLHRGDNRVRVTAADRAGNVGAAEVVARWEPVRTLGLTDAGRQQEGRRVLLDPVLTSTGEVMGLSFVVRYDPDWFQDPEFTWAESLSSGIRQVNADVVGEVRFTLALSSPIPAGAVALGQLGLRARTVPTPTPTTMPVQILDVSDALGNRLPYGTDTREGQAVVVPRRIVGDNNANDRLDVGDATAIQRYLVALTPPRPWDIPANDLNASLDLDSGDAVKALRAAVGLDPQPPVPGAGAGLANPAPAAPTANGTTVLSADKWRGNPGERITVQVRLSGLADPIAGASFHLAYPARALRLVDAASMRPGSMVPPSTLTLWNVESNLAAQEGVVGCACSSATPWSASNGVLAELTFEVQPGAHREPWPLELNAAEATSPDGLDLLPLAAASLVLNPLPVIQSQPHLGPDGFHLSFTAIPGLTYTIEGSIDLATWIPLGTRTGAETTLTFTDAQATTLPMRFYRVREGP